MSLFSSHLGGGDEPTVHNQPSTNWQRNNVTVNVAVLLLDSSEDGVSHNHFTRRFMLRPVRLSGYDVSLLPNDQKSMNVAEEYTVRRKCTLCSSCATLFTVFSVLLAQYHL